MDFPFSSAVVSIHAHATEDEQRVVEILKSLLPNSAEIKKSCSRGHHGNPITVFEVKLSQKKLIKDLWQRMLSEMREGALARLNVEFSGRIDDSCFLYLRFDKQSAYGGELIPTVVGDAVHLRFKVLSFPAEREVAIGKVKDFLEAKMTHEA
jgi:RNA binding exosome subunit